MTLNAEREWIIAYDIANPKRLVRVHRFMCKHAIAQQHSVFKATLSTAQMRKLKEELAQLIDPKEDDVRLYPLPAQPEIVRLGRLDVASRGIFVE
jgi:CRISPR-associated protein Cas2